MKTERRAPIRLAVAVGLAFASVIWVGWCIYRVHHGYREKVLDQFLHSPELDHAVGAGVRLIEAYWLPTVAIAVAVSAWLAERSGRARFVLSLLLMAWLGGLAFYVTRPSYDAEMERRMLELIQRQER